MDFSFLGMMFNYDERLVENTRINGYEIDTVEVNDRSWQYETAIKHKDINDGKWVVVQGYSSKEEAEKGHEKWVIKCRKNINTLFDIEENEKYEKED